MSESRFCGTCGAPAAPSDAFCTACGGPMVPAAPPATPTPPVPTGFPCSPAPGAPATAPRSAATSGEHTLAIIGNLTQTGGFMGMKQKTYSLVITDRRLIFAELTREKITAMVNQARDAAKADGKGFFGQWGAQLGTSYNYHEAYRQMAPDAVLAEEPGNFAIERSAFQGAKFKLGVVDDQHNTPDQLIIKAASGKYKFTVSGGLGAIKDRFREAGLL